MLHQLTRKHVIFFDFLDKTWSERFEVWFFGIWVAILKTIYSYKQASLRAYRGHSGNDDIGSFKDYICPAVAFYEKLPEKLRRWNRSVKLQRYKTRETNG